MIFKAYSFLAHSGCKGFRGPSAMTQVLTARDLGRQWGGPSQLQAHSQQWGPVAGACVTVGADCRHTSSGQSQGQQRRCTGSMQVLAVVSSPVAAASGHSYRHSQGCGWSEFGRQGVSAQLQGLVASKPGSAGQWQEIAPSWAHEQLRSPHRCDCRTSPMVRGRGAGVSSQARDMQVQSWRSEL